MTEIIVTNKKGWLGHPQGTRVDTEKVKPVKPKKENAGSKKASTRETATK